MKKTLIIIALMLCISNAYAQETRAERKALKEAERLEKRERKDSLQSLPIETYLSLDLIDGVIPTPLGRLNIGYITPISEKWSAGGSVGVGIGPFNYLRSTENYFLFEFRPELIYNLGKKRRFQHYLGVELFYVNNKETLFNSNFEPVNDMNGEIELIAYDQADFRRIKYGVVFNYGEYINFSDRLALRTTFGAGIRIKDVSFKNLVNPTIDFFNTDSFILNNPDREGSRLGFEFNLDLKLIYKLKI